MNRRQFLAAMGLSTSSLLLPSLGSRAGSPSVPPQRFLIFYTMHGLVPDGWQMRFGGLPDDTEWEQDLTSVDQASFSEILRPLHPWRERMLVADGLGLVSSAADLPGLAHEAGRIHSLTGGPMTVISGNTFGSSPSLDQLIASHIARPDRFRSLELGVGITPGPNGDFSAVYLDALQQLPYEADPRVVHQRLFGTDSITSRQTSILDLVAAQYAALEPRLSAADRDKIALHRDLVRDLEIRLSGLQGMTCDDPPALPAADLGYADTFDAQISLIQAAFSCDLTRVVTLQAAQLPNELLGVGPGDVHNDYAHQYHLDPEAHDVMVRYGVYHAEQFASLLAALDAIPEGDGSLLDHTTVLWVGELGDGAHHFDGWPAVIVGGRSLRLGRYLRWPATTPMQPGEDPSFTRMGVPHQHLLVSLAQTMGLDIDEVGTSEITGTWGDRIDCTGPLPGLT